MTLSDSLGAEFGKVARQSPDFPAIISDDFVLSYQQLWALTKNCAFQMQKHGVDADSVIAVNTQNMAISLATLLASSLLGARYVVANNVLADIKALSPTHFFRSEEVKGSARAAFILMDEHWLEGHAEPQLPTVSLNTDWLYLHTSGSTGSPKFFGLSQHVCYNRARAAKVDFAFQTTRYRPLQKVNTRPFFMRALAALFQTCTLVDSQDIAFWHRAGVTLVSGSPAQALGTFAEHKSPFKFELLEIAGAKTSDRQLRKLLKHFETVENTYGAGETSKTYANMCTLDENGEIAVRGMPQDSQIKIVNAAGKPCATGEVGKIRIKNGYTISGYLNTPEAQNLLLEEGWYAPGDMAQWGHDGALIIHSRTDDIINIGGVKADALLIDMLLESVDGITKAACFKSPKPDIPDELLAFVEFEPLTVRENCIYRAQEACQAALGPYFTPRRIHAIAKIPLTEKGTINRVMCQNILMDRLLKAEEKAPKT